MRHELVSRVGIELTKRRALEVRVATNVTFAVKCLYFSTVTRNLSPSAHLVEQHGRRGEKQIVSGN